MDRDKRRTLIIVITVAVLLIGPLVMISPWGVSHLERMAQENVDKPWAANLQLRCAMIYGSTLQRQRERAAYETFYNTFTTDPRRGYAKYMMAVCLDRDFRDSRRAAIEAYQDFLDEFEDDEVFRTYPEWQNCVRDAKAAIDRLKIATY